MLESFSLNVVYKEVTTKEELIAILKLQKLNMSSSISREEKLNEGFVTVCHNYEILKKMNDACPHTIATLNGNVIGYALSMVKEFKDSIRVLKPMFNQIETCLTPNISYMVMGQICVEKTYRKKGLFRGLYAFMQSKLNKKFEVLITEVDVENLRSLNAHTAIGFKELNRYVSNSQKWVLLSWNW